ncbi:hypothetical protein DBV15_03499 [Temnothorax longispinosus]|uniref:Uncharacterized protein n=1 Tax=Temnothorax longispinosus TaxID=300112 RepID=A0A4S2KV80_9HYME|nr:hypothetical protein DBV15_03499 [Temnothorax longispinosus]
MKLEAADFSVDFSEVVATEVEISQFDEISESAIVYRVDAIIEQFDVFQIGEPGKSADYNARQFVSTQSEIRLDKPANESFGIESILLKNNDSVGRCLKSANKCPDNGTTLWSKKSLTRSAKVPLSTVWMPLSDSLMSSRLESPAKVPTTISSSLFNPRKAPLGNPSSRFLPKSRLFISVNLAKESGATRDILFLLSLRNSSLGLRLEKDSASIASISLPPKSRYVKFDSPANESFGIELISLDPNDSDRRCLKSANKYPDNGTTLPFKERLSKLGRPRKDSLFSTDIRLLLRSKTVADTFLKAFSRIAQRFSLRIPKFDSPANESFGIELILLDFNDSNHRCLKSANMYPDNGTTLPFKERYFKLGKPRNSFLISVKLLPSK